MMKVWVVGALERLCGLLDRLFRGAGCRFRLGHRAYLLADRWDILDETFPPVEP